MIPVHTVMMFHDISWFGVTTRADLRKGGASDWQIRQMLRDGLVDGTVRRLARGQWATSRALFDPAGDFPWRVDLAARIARCESQGVASHRSAARLHGLEGRWGDAFDVHVAVNGRRETPGTFRTRPIPLADIVLLHEIRCTSLVRTLVELGRVVDADSVELALEGALRGEDPRRPDVWNEGLLQELLRFPTSPRVLGHARLKAILRGRPNGARPTGSGAETRFLQALRSVGLDRMVERQASVTVINHPTGHHISAFPDFLFPSFGLVVEIDGVSEHSGFDRRTRDDHRENRLSSALRVLRFTGVDVFRRPSEIAREVAREVGSLRGTELRPGVAHRESAPWTHQYTVLKPGRDGRAER